MEKIKTQNSAKKVEKEREVQKKEQNAQKVSVIVPVFNLQNLIRRAVFSIENQTYKNLQIILVDDGSTDESGKICDEMAQSDERIFVIHKKNGGVSSARNAALAYADGDFVQFVDGDDFLESDAIECLVGAIGECDLAVCGYFRHGKKVKIVQPCKGENVEKIDFCACPKQYFELEKQSILRTMWNKLYRREKLQNLFFDEQLFIGEDAMFNLEYLQHCNCVTLLSKPLYHYDFGNQNSIMHTKVRSKEQFDEYWQKIYQLCRSFFCKESDVNCKNCKNFDTPRVLSSAPKNLDCKNFDTDKAGENFENCKNFDTAENYLRFLNGMYLREVMLQIINTCIRQKLSYRDFRKLFKAYRGDEKTKAAMKNCDKNFLKGDRIFGKILNLIFRLRLCFAFRIVASVYKIWHYGK